MDELTNQEQLVYDLLPRGIENGGVNKQRVKSSKKAKERIEWLEERIKKYQIEKDFLEEKVLKEVEN